MRRSNTRSSMLEGSLWDKILFFALPITASSFLQQLFNSADIAVVGNFAGSGALAAVGANSSVVNLLVNTFVGLSVGTTVLISRSIGQNRPDAVRKAVHTSIPFAVLIGILVMIVGLNLAPVLLGMMSTPAEILDQASLYLRIYCMGAPFIMLYNFEAAILRSSGNTRRPLVSLTMAGVVNVLLNLFFVIVLHMGVEGVAIATVASNVISSIDLFRYLQREQGLIHLNVREMRLDKESLKSICSVGVPSSLQGAVFSLSNVMIQSSLNTFGALTIAGSAAAANFEGYAFFVIMGFGQATVTFIGQNYGAGKMDRCRRVIWIALLEATIGTLIVTSVFIVFAPTLITIFTSDPEVAANGVIRMRTLLPFEMLSVVMEIMTGAMRGFGYSMIPSLISVFGVVGVRLLWIWFWLPSHHTFQNLVACYPISWGITDIGLIISFLWMMNRIRRNENPAVE